MKKYTLALLAVSAAFLARNAMAGEELSRVSVQPQPKAVVVSTSTSASTDSSDCGCSTPKPLIHFKDGIPSNGPVTADAAYADPEGNGCGCSSEFGFRDYGPARAPEPAPTPAPVKRPNS
jgi:hypothetical protein